MEAPFGRRKRPRARKFASGLRVPDALDVEMLDTQMEMTSALMFAVEWKEHQLHVVSHCARVSLTATWLAQQAGIAGDTFHDLQYAARMHEVGMIAVPTELLRKPGPLTAEELERIRSQARIGAEVARTMRRPLAGVIIENQYTDYEALRRRFAAGSTEFLLTGILRVADVFDALTTPRPYQRPVPESRGLEILRAGAGTKFHPDAVQTLLRGWSASAS